MDKRMRRKIRIGAVVLVVLAIVAGVTAWHKLYRDVPQPAWITADQRDDFLYGSVGAEGTAGIPYWIWLVLPRICRTTCPARAATLPSVGRGKRARKCPRASPKKTVGYVRVAANCALCHAASYRATPDATPEVVAAIPGHTVDLQPLLTFLKQCAQDPRFNAGELLAEIDMATKLSFLDRLIYRFILIPRTRQALIDQNSVILDATLRAHSQNPSAPFFRRKAQSPLIELGGELC